MRLTLMGPLGTLVACNALSGLDDGYQLAPLDAGIEAAATDSGPRDATPPPADAGPSPGALDCENPPSNTVFCTSFDGDKPLDAFYRKEVTGGEPVIADGAGIGGSRALRARARSTGGTVASVLWLALPSAITVNTSVVVRFDLRVVSVVDYAAVGVLQFSAREHGLAVYGINCPTGSPCLDETDQQTRGHDWAGALKLGAEAAFVRVEFNVQRTAASYSGRVTVDGQVVDERAANAMPAGPPSGPVEVGFGAFFTGNRAGTTEVLIDDVVVRVF